MLIVICVILACFACSDDNNDEYSYNSLEGKELVNGTVIDSVPMAGTVAVIGKKNHLMMTNLLNIFAFTIIMAPIVSMLQILNHH
ncbi:MAG: hypothetical protein OMM_09031 [Candidatus Magnetoglobus multicellularis str. Araruama]|uniref:Uncharacterized protein n=1 Tax=Candidatus Magnetoglobus multicellularis str. Araruama TaxID=890399 RepID=A0A1V1P5W9_9BACT|nr:MAG: hypothetical protein OMM_09031 [Candidatus Magnetoglobus multicellularis str. Araruama]